MNPLNFSFITTETSVEREEPSFKKVRVNCSPVNFKVTLAVRDEDILTKVFAAYKRSNNDDWNAARLVYAKLDKSCCSPLVNELFSDTEGKGVGNLRKLINTDEKYESIKTLFADMKDQVP